MLQLLKLKYFGFFSVFMCFYLSGIVTRGINVLISSLT